MYGFKTVVLACASAATLTAALAQATTPAGSIILNQARATYFDVERNSGFEVISTIASVRIKPTPSFVLHNELSLIVNAGETVVFAHQLENTGNQTDYYVLGAQTPDSDISLLNPAIYHDINQNGTIDFGEPIITRTNSIAPGSSMSILLTGDIPTTASAGQDFYATLSATSEVNPNLSQSRTDRATIVTDKPFRVLKSAAPDCATPVAPGETITYELQFLNLDSLLPNLRDFEIDGVIQRGFLIEDEIPANTELVESTGFASAPANAITIVRDADTDRLISYEKYSEGNVIKSVGLFIPENYLNAGQSGRLKFKVRTGEAITPGTVVNNIVGVDFDGDGLDDVQSNPVCNILSDSGYQDDALLRFLEPSPSVRKSLNQSITNSQFKSSAGPRHDVDEDYVDAGVYLLNSFPDYLEARDGVYLEVRSSSLNERSYAVDTETDNRYIRIKVESRETGDALYTRVKETNPNSGLFRVETPFYLSETSAGEGRDCSPFTKENCVLKSTTGDVLRATIFDKGTKAVLKDSAVVNPQGIVFDSASYASVPGAVVNFIAQDGSQALDINTGEPIADQITDETGHYAIPRLEDGQYAVTVTPPQNYSFPSTVSPTIFASRYTVDNRSYGRAGYSSQGNGLFTSNFDDASPTIDIPLDPDLQLGQLQLEKSASQASVNFGDFVNYELRVHNGNDADIFKLKVDDILPRGFQLIEDSITLNGEALSVVRHEPRRLTFPLGHIKIGETDIIRYTLRVGPEARPGEAVNTAVAQGETVGQLLSRSPVVRESVRVRDDGLLSDRGYVIGTVFIDYDDNNKQDENEPGIPAARIWFDDGTWIETDERGHYSLYGVKPGMRVARLDATTVPRSLSPSISESRHIAKGWARFVDLTAGELHRANFALRCSLEKTCLNPEDLDAELVKRAEALSPDAILTTALAYEGLIGETIDRRRVARREQAGIDGDVSAGVVSGAGRNIPRPKLKPDDSTTQAVKAKVAQINPESLAKTLVKDEVKSGKWYWPLKSKSTDKDIISRDGKFIIAMRSGVSPTLYIDGKAVSKDSLGALIENRAAASQVAAWYGVDLTPGRHQVEVRGTDNFGNERILTSQSVFRPGDAKTIKLSSPTTPLEADGVSVIEIGLHILDADGIPAMGTHFVTLQSTAFGITQQVGFITPDIQPETPGHQIRVRDGIAYVKMRAPKKAGEFVITANDGGELKSETTLVFAEPIREIIAVGLVELSGQIANLGGKLEPAFTDEFPNSLETKARTKIFLKGRVKGDALLTFAYDSEKTRDDGLFRDIDPEAYYPIYGDASEKGFEAQSRSKIYIRLEKKGVSAMWGDFRSDSQGLDNLTRMRRALTGFNTRVAVGNWLGQFFAAETEQQTRTERIRGAGTALNYILPGAPLVPGSEVLTVEVRDKDTPGLFISETPLTRLRDYQIDFETGRLSLKAPLPSFDEDGNLVFLRARYEVREDKERALTAGARLAHETEKTTIWAGVNYDEDGEIVDQRLTGSIGGALRTKNGEGWVEVGHMDTRENDGEHEGGYAIRAGYDGRLLGGTLKVEIAKAETGFQSPDSPILAGRLEGRASYDHSIGKNSTGTVKLTHSESLDSGASRSTALGLVKTQIKDWTIGTGLRYSETLSDTRNDQHTSGLLRAERSFKLFGLGASGYGEVEQDLTSSDGRVLIGGDLLVGEDMRVYGSYSLVDSLSNRTPVEGLTDFTQGASQSRITVGAEASILPNTTAFGEWRIGGGLDGQTGEAGYGIRTNLEILEGVSIAPQLEITERIGGNEDDERERSAALSVAVTDKRSKTSRRSVRAEVRDANASTYYGVRAGWAQQLSDRYTGAIKFDGAYDKVKDGKNLRRVKTTIGMASRPADGDKADWFALYQNLSEEGRDQDRNLQIASAHANRQLDDHWVISGRAVAKWGESNGRNGSAQLAGVRLMYNPSKKWDLEAKGALRAVDWGTAAQSSIGVAAGYKVTENTRIAVGYNFTGYEDKDLDRRGYDAQGVYWNLSVAVDESWFNWLN